MYIRNRGTEGSMAAYPFETEKLCVTDVNESENQNEFSSSTKGIEKCFNCMHGRRTHFRNHFFFIRIENSIYARVFHSN
jgi:hypothetical protein